MAQLDIKALTDIMREFDGQVTVRGLSSDLGISYSTFARANRSGVWPKSLTNGSVLAVLDDYCERYFGGNGRVLADFVIAHLRMRGIEVRALEEALGQDGPDAFAAELLAQVHEANPDGAVARLLPSTRPVGQPREQTEGRPEERIGENSEAQADTEGDPEHAEPAAGPTSPSASPMRRDRALELAVFVPTATILLMGVLRMSLSSAYRWAAAHRLAFFGVSVAIAVIPALVGILVDAPLAWHAWHRGHADEPFSWRAFRRVAKFGAPNGIVCGAGRFNLTLPYLLFQPVCNLTSMLCYQALFSLMLSLPGFGEFFCGHEWVEYFKVGIVVSYYVAWEFVRDQCTREFAGDPESEVCENPDNYLPSRVHMWANTLHLVWTVSLIIVGLMGVFAYSVANFRTMPAPAILAWPYVQGLLFFVFSSLAPYAIRTHATGIGVFVPSIMALSVGFFCLASLCYLPSAAGVVLCAGCVACCAAILAWERKARRSDLGEWLDAWRGAGAYPAIVTATIIGLLVVELAMVSFG